MKAQGKGSRTVKARDGRSQPPSYWSPCSPRRRWPRRRRRLDGQPDQQDHHLRPGRHAQRHADEQRRGRRRPLGRLRPGHHADRLLRGPLQGDHGRGRLLHRHLQRRGHAAADDVLPLPVGGRRDVRRQQQRRDPRAGQAVARQAHLPVVGQGGKKFTVRAPSSRARASGRPSRSRPTAGTATARTPATRRTTATVSGTEYKASITISKTGKYKFKATTAGERAVRRQRDQSQQRADRQEVTF